LKPFALECCRIAPMGRQNLLSPFLGRRVEAERRAGLLLLMADHVPALAWRSSVLCLRFSKIPIGIKYFPEFQEPLATKAVKP
jgi:hypothetical protein